ncbi:MAG TPA: hypothetical protein VGE21_10590 [Flavobacteriales bacterium]
MRGGALFIGLFLMVGTIFGQQPVTERMAKQAVYRIVQHSGLLPNFVVQENRSIPTAIAFIKNRKRYIEYNPAFISAVMDSSHTDWSAVSILAHEIAHHLLGHTLDPAQLHPGDELACDRYSGFILHALGADRQQALAAMEVAGNPHGTAKHPPKHARLEAIEQGWDSYGSAPSEELTTPVDFRYTVRFEGDPNTYYVDATDQVVWFNNYAEAIGFGEFGPSTEKGFAYQLTWSGQLFQVDRNQVIWRPGVHGMPMKVGQLIPFRTE